MYAGTKVNWHEVLMQNQTTIPANNESLPLFLCTFSSDKGPEDIKELTYDEFKSLYGEKPNFFKHGQPQLQTYNILASGGRVMCKRLVAEDSTLANVIICATLSQEDTEQAVDEDGNPLYIAPDGSITTESEHWDEAQDVMVPNEPLMNQQTKISYSKESLEGADTSKAVLAKARSLKTENTFPLFVICDNGRGDSIKSVRISPDYEVSKKLPYMLYKISDIENTLTIESQRFAVKDDIVNVVDGANKNMFLFESTMTQMNAQIIEDCFESYVDKLAELTTYTKDELYAMDILFAKTVKQQPLDSLVIDEEGLDINSQYGIGLEYGDNGNFGDAPFAGIEAGEAWAAEAIKFFDGTFSDEIYDLDQHMIDFCVDANYPDNVKSAIFSLANFREDFFYFRDLGIGINTLADIQSKVNSFEWGQSPFVGDYESTYDIIDPVTHRQIKVTMCYGMAANLVAHYSNNMAAPMAGEFNNFVITNAVENTLNLIPRITPRVNQKETLDDLRVNYANINRNNLLAVQSTYTTQDHDGPLSYSNNVIVTQMLIKAIRRYCPRIRFMLMDVGNVDFSKYKNMIEENVISHFASFFKSVELVYTRDDAQIAAKVFNASVKCYYRDFAQGEIFDVFAIEGSPDTNPV